MSYNSEKYIQLLGYQKELLSQNKFLMKENPAKYSELLRYSARLSEHFHWLHKHQFMELINDFLSFKISAKDFDQKFSQLVREIEKKCHLKNYQELENIEVNSKSIGFGKKTCLKPNSQLILVLISIL